MKRLRVLQVLAAMALNLVLAAATYAAEKPNILIIWGDDIGPFNISAYNMGICLAGLWSL